MSKLISQNARKLTAAQFQQLSDVPPEMEWFANIDNKHPRAAYQNDIKKYRGRRNIGGRRWINILICSNSDLIER